VTTAPPGPPRPQTEELLPWFTLKGVKGVGNLLFKRLIERFETPARVLSASRDQLTAVAGIAPRLAAAIGRALPPDDARREIDEARRRGWAIVPLTAAGYPLLLREIPDPPPFLYVAGRIDPSARHIALVGSRNATGYGLGITRQLARDLTAADVTVASGMARGIDTAAHWGALEGGGRTVAVLGCGLGTFYPPENRKLWQAIVARGAVLSELPINAAPEAHHFPARNRIISGLSLGTVVVEAARKSGSLITARLANEQGREVFAVPGSVQSYKSAGTHRLIQQGAKLVASAADILEEFPYVFPAAAADADQTAGAGAPEPAAGLSVEETRLWQALGPYPTHIDDLARSLCLAAGQLAGLLLQLELKGLVRQSPGMHFERIEKP
jgi:DNA processing protein